MKRIARQGGAVGALVLVVFVLVMLGLAASYLLSRVDNTTADRTQTLARLGKAAEALDAFAGTARRLPCPADPALDTGEEVLPAPNSVNCSFPATGTIPWKTIGLRRDDAYDAWGRKVSYRVFAGGTGLTQIAGASMVDCDTSDPTPSGVGANGLCVGNADVYLKSSSPTSFVTGKGLSVNDSGTAYADAAYVVASHGATGFGGYSGSGARLMPLPVSVDERNNTNASGPFTIRAFSDSETAPTSALHFDDILAYRRIADLAARAGLAARDWPDTWALFSQPNVERAIGHSVTPGQSIGSPTMSMPNVTIGALDSSGPPPDISFDIVGGVGGIGVMNGSSSHLESNQDEFLEFEFGRTSRKFAATLNHFGTYGNFNEIVIFQYYMDDTLLRTGFGIGCKPDGGLASFSQDVGQDFNRVVVSPFFAVNFMNGAFGITTFLVSEVNACSATQTCTASLATPANTCTGGFV